LQTFAEALGQNAESFAKLGLFGDSPVELGSRCTVFMNSSVKQAQKDGASIENISAGLAISVVKNALYKVIRAPSTEALGKNIVVQGGAFYNDAVLRAFEKELGRNVVRPAIAGLMGAFGAALYGKEKTDEIAAAAASDAIQSGSAPKSGILGLAALRSLTHSVQTVNCGLCTNNCNLTVNRFSGGRKYIGGNRCERPAGNPAPEEGLNLYKYKLDLLDSYKPVPGPRGKIGIPMGLNFFETLPFWHTLLTRLGFEVVTSPRSTPKLYLKGQNTIPSDTACYPAKLLHGHIRALCETEGIDTIFYPCMSYNIDEGLGENHYNCPVVAYYPELLNACCPELAGKTFIYDYVGIHRPKDFAGKFTRILSKYYGGITKKAVKAASAAAYREYERYLGLIRAEGAAVIARARARNLPIVALAGRPYHADKEVNHGIDTLLLSHGAAVVSEDSICMPAEKQPLGVLNQWTYHARLYAAAKYVATQNDMLLLQLVSFGCGLDAVTTDEVRAIMHRAGRLYTQVKIDEIANPGAVIIRIRSLLATIPPAKRKFASQI
jgi:predicted nucleotide-binding protein (sugar kinase/HSP70/actin superfamily)